MKQIITAITNDQNKQALIIIVNIKNPNEKPYNYAIQALHDVANDFAKTTIGHKFLKATNNNFNYGDLLDAPIPKSIWDKHDIELIDSFVSYTCVNHDEQLIEL